MTFFIAVPLLLKRSPQSSLQCILYSSTTSIFLTPTLTLTPTPTPTPTLSATFTNFLTLTLCLSAEAVGGSVNSLRLATIQEELIRLEQASADHMYWLRMKEAQSHLGFGIEMHK